MRRFSEMVMVKQLKLHVLDSRSLYQLRTNPLRTLLTLLGMVFGVGSVVAMVSIGEGAQREILASIDAMGADIVHLKSKPVAENQISNIINDSVGLNPADIAAINTFVPHAHPVAYRASYEVGVTNLEVPVHSINVFGVSDDLFQVHQLAVNKGRPLLAVDQQQCHRTVVLGPALAQRAFPHGALGKIIRLEYAYFEVVGILKSIRSGGGNLPIDFSLYNDAILLPFCTALEELHPAKGYAELDQVSLRVPKISDTLNTKKILGPTIKALHGGVDDFEIVAPEEILEKRQAAQSIMNIVLTAIAAISLIVGGIGVMNIMLANIMERIAEIGLRRAIGARKKDIRNQFLLESVIICFIGGCIGIVLGLLISFVVAHLASFPIAFAWESMALAFVISVGVGLIFGMVPAMRAAQVNPIEALQREAF